MGKSSVGFTTMHRTAALLSGFIALMAFALPARADRQRIVVRATSVLPDDVARVLDEWAEPITRRVDVTTDMKDVLRQQCGSYSVWYFNKFKELNAAVAPFGVRKAAISVTLPACARVFRNASRTVRPGDTPAKLLIRELGAAPAIKVPRCPPDGSETQCTTIGLGDWITQLLGPVPGRFDELAKPPSEVLLPFASAWTTLTLRDGKEAGDAVEALRATATRVPDIGDGLLQVQKAPDVDLIAPLTSERLTEGPCAPSNTPRANWPFDRNLVRQALEAGAAFSPARQKAVIRVADTGVERLGQSPGFGAAFLAVDPRATNKDYRNLGYRGAYYGFNVELNGRVEPFGNDPNAWHGTGVADLALGTEAFRNEYPGLSAFIGLNVARVFTNRYQSSGVWADVPALQMSLSYKPPPPSVINFSVGGNDAIPSILPSLDALYSERKVLVIAAGNDGISLDDWVKYPASYAANERYRGSIIVVGAHTPAADGGEVLRASFSNYGTTVDLLAPGCLIPAPFGGTDYLAGTSFAAPLVSFTVALLQALLPDAESGDIRARLWASTRRVPGDIADNTRFGGVLDVPTALRVFDDVVRMKDGTLAIGVWEYTRSLELCAGLDPINAASVLRIRVEAQPNGAPRLHVLRRLQGGEVKDDNARECLPASPSFKWSSEGGLMEDMRWDKIEALIPADASYRRPTGPMPLSAPRPQAVALIRPGVSISPLIDEATAGMAPEIGLPMPPPFSLQVQVIQSALNAAGVGVATDGIAGRQTTSAIRSFQLQRREAPTGQLSSVQVQALTSIIGGR